MEGGEKVTSVTVTGDVTYYARYESILNEYTITFKDYDGKVIQEDSYVYGTNASDITLPINPTRESTAQWVYTFAGWTPSLVKVTGDKTYTATYTQAYHKYTIRFINYDGTVIKESSYDYGIAASKVVTPATPTKPSDSEYNYKFSSWTPGISAVYSDRDYTAVYTATKRKYAISFDTDGGSEVSSMSIPWGDTITSPTEPKKPGYKFMGWSPLIPSVMPKEDITVSAVWEETTYKLYIINHSSYTCSMADGATIVYGRSYYVQLEGLTNQNMAYWYDHNTDTTIIGSYYYLTAPAEDVTLEVTVKEYWRDGNIVKLGTYPQTMAGSSLQSTLTKSYASTLPTSSNSNGWTAYSYYDGTTQTNYMWYKDITYKNDKYRGVYFTSYRAEYSQSATASYSYIDNNGYTANTVYWFKFEPIQWMVVSESNGNLTLMAQFILDAQEYCRTTTSGTKFSHNGGTEYAYSYLRSDIRQFLINSFYKEVFSTKQKNIIVKSEYGCTTKDSVGLPTQAVMNNLNSALRTAYATDYSQCQNLNTTSGVGTYYTSITYNGDSTYRSITIVTGSGGQSYKLCYYNSVGLRPVVTIQS